MSFGLLLLGWGCTLLEEEFEPPPSVPSDSEARDAGAAGAAGAPAIEVPGCGSDAGNGVLRSSEGSVCPGAIPIAGNGDAGALPDGGQASLAGLERRCENGLGEFGPPERVTGLGLNGELFGPSVSADRLTLYFAARSGDTEHIYTAVRGRPGSAEFSNAVELTSTSSARLDGTPFISFDGLSIYFFSDRGPFVGARDLWSARREDVTSPFGPAFPLTALNTPALDMSPSLSRDELTILFVSSRPNGRGNGENTDIWRSTRESTTQGFGPPLNVDELNSGADEGRIVLSSDGLLGIFASDRATRGFPDLWMTSRSDANAPFGAPQNLEALNSPETDQDVALTSDDRELFFASERAGESALFRSVRACL